MINCFLSYCNFFDTLQFHLYLRLDQIFLFIMNFCSFRILRYTPFPKWQFISFRTDLYFPPSAIFKDIGSHGSDDILNLWCLYYNIQRVLLILFWWKWMLSTLLERKIQLIYQAQSQKAIYNIISEGNNLLESIIKMVRNVFIKFIFIQP